MNWKSLENNSYVPYSAEPKACVVESRTGKFYAGVRVENIAYPLTIPAVQAACCICLSEGEIPKKLYIKERNLEQLDFWVKEFELDVQLSEDISDVKLVDLFQTSSEHSTNDILTDLLEKSVTPNSNFPVAAVLFVNKGHFEGVNIEVSEWTKGLCAERVALAKAFASGLTEFQQLEVQTKKGEFSSPCGACRQVLIEHLPHHEITLHHADGTCSEHVTLDLLPFNFKSSSLKK